MTQKLGLDQTQSRTALASILKYIRQQLSGEEFAEVAEQLPGAEGLASEAPAETAVGGLMGSLASMAGGLLGGESAAGLTEALASSGISVEKIPGLLSVVVPFLKAKLGPDLFQTLADKVPGLGAAS